MTLFKKKSPNGKPILSEKEVNQQKIVDTQQAIYDWNFKRFKNRVERERYRVEYDNLKAKQEQLLQVIDAQAKTPTMRDDDIARLPDERDRTAKQLKEYEEKMQQCDNELSGVAPTAENTAGLPGIETMIEALRDLAEVYKAYVKIL